MANKEIKAREAAKFLDNLTEFLTTEDRDAEEVAGSLREQGVDPGESLRQFHEILSEYAPTWREKAARARARLALSFESQKVRVLRSRADIQCEIREVIETMRTLGSQIEAGAYYRKFEEAQDEDLKSLLEDLRFQRDLLERKDKADTNG